MGLRRSGYIQVHWISGRTEMWNLWLVREDGKRIMSSPGSFDTQKQIEEAIAWIRPNVGRVAVPQNKGRPPRPPVNS